MKNEAAYRLALADAMQLHNERVSLALARTRSLRRELEQAEADQRAVMKAKQDFIDAIKKAGT